MKAHRRMLAVGALALSAALVAGPAYADDHPRPHPDIKISERVDSQEIDCSAAGLINLLSPLNLISCFSFEAD